MIASRSVSCSAVEHVERFGDRQVDVVGDRPPLHLHRQALRLQPLAVAGRARPQRCGYGSSSVLLRPAALVVAAAQVRQQPFELPCPAAEQQHLARLPRQPRERHVEIDAEVARQRLQRVAHQLAVAARPRRDRAVGQRLRSRPARRACGSKSIIAPSPWQSGQAPCGELNENARGVISGMLRPQSTHASRRENSRSPPSNVLMTTMSSARLSATSTDSVSRRSTPPRTITRSTTTSMVWLRRRSSLMSSSSERNWPSMRALV